MNLRATFLLFVFLMVSVPLASAQPLSCKQLFNETVATADAKVRSSSTEIDKGIAASDLTNAQIELMQTHSAEMLSFTEFLKRNVAAESYVYVLSISTYHQPIYHSIYFALLHASKNFIHWFDAYEQLRVPIEDHSKEFMEKLTKTGSLPIYFVVPDNVLTGLGEKSYTRNEMKWLLEHPQRMANVHFVFGARQIMSENEWKDWLTRYPLTDKTEEECISARELARKWLNEGHIKEVDFDLNTPTSITKSNEPPAPPKSTTQPPKPASPLNSATPPAQSSPSWNPFFWWL